jgi:hypothetical protein
MPHGEWKRKVIEPAIERMRSKPAWLQRAEALEIAERDKKRQGIDRYPDPDDEDGSAAMRQKAWT